METEKLKALRGAVCCVNTAESIAKNTVDLYDTILQANSLKEADLISIFFSVTPDLNVLNPAAALRCSGRAEKTAMMVFQEAVVQDGLPNTIRILIHCCMEDSRPVQHAYIGGAEKLRPDWALP